MSDKDEVERIKRLRDRQLSARDPLAYNTRLQRKISRQHRDKKRFTFKDLIEFIPYKWWGVILGALIGLILWIVVSLFVTAAWVDWAGVALAIVLAIVGFIIGQAFDARAELQKLVK